MREDSNLLIRSGAVTRWNYAVSKLADEALALSYVRHLGIHVTIVRLFNTIGPRQTGRYGMVVPRFVEQATSGRPLTVYGDGRQRRCFCDVRDTVQALDLLLTGEGGRGEIVNVGNSGDVSILELAELVRERSSSSSPIELIPYGDAYGEEYEDIRERKPVLSKLVALTGFQHRYSLEETLDDLIAERKSTLEREPADSREETERWPRDRTSSSVPTPS